MNPEEQNKKPEIPKPNLHTNNEGNDLFIRPLRTYEDDVKNVVQKDSITTAKIMMAEQQKRQVEEEEFEETSIKSKTNITRIIMSGVLVLLGVAVIGGGSYYLFINRVIPQPQNTVFTSNNFIDVNKTSVINKTNKTNRETVGLIRNDIKKFDSENKKDFIGEIKLLKSVLTIVDGRETYNDVEITTEDFFNILETREPDPLIRSLDEKFLLGVHKTEKTAEPFIVFRVVDYDLAYANMLEWEKLMVMDVQDIFFRKLGSSQAFINYENKIPATTNEAPIIASSTNMTSTTTNSTTTVTEDTQTEQIIKQTYDPRDFKDLILSNKDTRTISDKDGNLLFFYSFIDKKHIVLTTNIESFSILINRLNSSKLIR